MGCPTQATTPAIHTTLGIFGPILKLAKLSTSQGILGPNLATTQVVGTTLVVGTKKDPLLVVGIQQKVSFMNGSALATTLVTMTTLVIRTILVIMTTLVTMTAASKFTVMSGPATMPSKNE